ncbi:sirohydrochlorin chelatase [Benzoatithermus flavus]|uniref:Sirohydrochlorin chelatase n=1 Tax=Benzoatithermus flavus TaxID=3108223 RepID=A0ABU8XK35_9PROT
MGRTGVMICGHGSRDAAACEEFRRVVDKVAAAMPEYPVAMGYLEFARPIIREGLDALRAQGVDSVLAVPGMLFAAGHVKNDVPSVLNTYAAEHGIRIAMGRDLGIDGKLLQASRERIGAALERAEADVPLDETCLVVIGRGTSDSDANGNVAKVARMLWEGMGFAHAEIGYSGVAHPRTEVAVERTTRLGFKRIVVFPYFLFTGVLVRRIYDAADAVAARHPEVEILKAHYLDDHPLVVETFVERIRGIEAGDVNMNCGLCKYRTRILGFERDLGAPQESHHHHVEGIGTDADHHHHHHHHHHGGYHHHHHGHHHHHEHGHDDHHHAPVSRGNGTGG